MRHTNYRDFEPNFQWLKENPACFLAFGCGVGLARYFPGTWGTLLAFIPAILFAQFSLPLLLLLLPTFVLFLVGIWACDVTEKRIGRKDYGGVVIDEVVAMMFILALVPATSASWITALVLFRLLDIWKPYPLSWLDKNVPGGLGCMLDDLAAGAAVVVLIALL